MATIKSYTDIEQSKKLAEILPLESADMYYFLDPTPAGNIYHIVIPQIDFGVKTRESEYDKGDIPCWSLTALLGVLPRIDIEKEICSDDTFDYRVKAYIGDARIGDGYIGDWFDNPVDACYEMILKLHELNLL